MSSETRQGGVIWISERPEGSKVKDGLLGTLTISGLRFSPGSDPFLRMLSYWDPSRGDTFTIHLLPIDLKEKS